jgi:ubiquinone/menaquinone biosynthesis C-methylase UbiE
MSNLEALIRRNVAGKNGGPPFYPGEPDPLAKAFGAAFQSLAARIATDAEVKGEAALLALLDVLCTQSGAAVARGLDVAPEVAQRLRASFEAAKAVASPLFLATRHLIGDMYAQVNVVEPALELGMGAGDTAKAIFGDRKIAVGTTPIIDEIRSAEHNYRNHRIYLAAEAGRVPFADATFNTVIMNYTFYHLEDALGACREVMRVLSPGGRFHFNIALRDRVEATRAVPQLVESLGFPDFARMARDFVFTDYGRDDATPTMEGTTVLLEAAGFRDIQVTEYLSSPLSRLIWFSRDLQILFLMDLQRALSFPAAEASYREFIDRQLSVLISNDAALCRVHGGTFAFFSARRPGSRQFDLPDDELVRRMACPRTGEPLYRDGHALRARHSGDAYPVYKGLPLLIEAYANIWREQNAGRGDPSGWPEFSY